MDLRFKPIVFLLLLSSFSAAFGQEGSKKKIELVQANYQEFSEDIHPDAQRLIGNVIMRHEDVIMHCDSAYLYDSSNSMDAFSNVHIKQGDSLNLYGDKLLYSARTKTAEVFDNIRLTDKEMILTTDYLIQNLRTNVAIYPNGGKIVSTENDNVLTSVRGEYYSDENLFIFRENVVLSTPTYVINTDSMHFDTQTEIAYFIGPTEIESDDSFIYCENGWSDTRNNISQFNKNAYIESDTQRMEGDSIYYDQNLGIGEAFQNIQITDTVNDYVITGHYAIHYDESGESLVTKEAMLTLIEGVDSLFLHGDTLFSVKDSADNTVVHAFHRVKFFRNDLQGKCDSLTYLKADSIITMYTDPIIWSEENQISGKLITLYLKTGGLDRMVVDKDSFIASEAGPDQYNQIKGNLLTGYFIDGSLSLIDVEGNGETVYYAKEEVKEGDDKDIGANRLICSDIRIHLKENEVQKIVFLDVPSGTLFPIEQVPAGDERLKGFRWDPEYRPLKKEDIFIKHDVALVEDEVSEPDTDGQESKPSGDDNKPDQP